MSDEIEAPFAERNLSVGVNDVRLALVNEVFDAFEPMLLPLVGNVVLIPWKIAINLFAIAVEVGVLRIRAVVRNAGEFTLLVGAMGDGHPFVSHPEMVADAESKSVLARG